MPTGAYSGARRSPVSERTRSSQIFDGEHTDVAYRPCVRILLALLAVGLVAGAPAAAAPAGHSALTHDYGPVFSPDGRTIAFVRTSTTPSLMLVDGDGRHLRTLVPNVRAQYLNWSPDGKSLLYSADGIWRVDLASSTSRRLTPAGPDIWQSDWSPDGRVIAFTQFERCFRCTGIWVMDADGSNPHELVQDGRRPTWSPDRSKLAVSLSETALVIGLDGSTLLRGGGAYATWSPHGVYVAYTSDGLWIESVATQTTRRVTRFLSEKPAWSPNGKIIAGGTRGHVELVRAKDGKRTKLFPDSSTAGGAPSWSDDGKVAFAHAHSCGIDVAREDGGGLRRLTAVC